jgi:hypothetical protein
MTVVIRSATFGSGVSITKTVQTTHTMTPAELDSYGEAEYTKLEHIYGTALEDKLRAAGHMIEQLEATTPGLTNVLKSRGIVL